MSSFLGWSQILSAIVMYAPWLLVVLIGAGLCLRHATDQRRRAVLVGISLLIHLTSFVFSLVASGHVYRLVQEATNSSGIARIIMGLMSTLPSAVALLLLLYAAFYGDPRPRDFADDAG